MNEDIYTAIVSLNVWIEKNGWSGYDPYDVRGTKLVRILLNKRYVNSVLDIFLNRFPIASRRILRTRKEIYAGSMINFARGYLNLYKRFGSEEYLRKALFALKWLIKNSNRNFEGFSWGLPFDWQSSILIPKNTPTGVTTSMALHAFLDAYEALGDERYLDIAKGCCSFLVNCLNIDYVSEDKVCFSYTPIDSFHIHNANLWVASALLRASTYIKDTKLQCLALKAINFTIEHQNSDGSWFYRAPPDNLSSNDYQVDNYHTGFVLECLNIARRVLKDKFTYGENLRKGLDYYTRYMFLGNGAPKYTRSSLYPIDTHSCAQAIITLSELCDFEPKKELIEKVAIWTIKNLQSDSGYFFYEINKFRNHIYIDKTPYIRWQAWMLRALSYIV